VTVALLSGISNKVLESNTKLIKVQLRLFSGVPGETAFWLQAEAVPRTKPSRFGTQILLKW